jgi:hypothetical protein
MSDAQGTWTAQLAAWRRDADENHQLLGLAESPDGDGRVLMVQRALESDEQDRDLGMDTYCLVDEAGLTHYGGVTSAVIDDDVLRIALDDQAAEEFGQAELAVALGPALSHRLVRYALATLLRADGELQLTDEHAAALVGSHLLVGLTYEAPDGDVVERLQFDGVVEGATPAVVSVRRNDTGELFTLPPAADAFVPAPEGEYRLRESGRVVADPDFLCTMTVRLAEDPQAT